MAYWKCPGCGFEARDDKQRQEHMMRTAGDPKHARPSSGMGGQPGMGGNREARARVRPTHGRAVRDHRSRNILRSKQMIRRDAVPDGTASFCLLVKFGAGGLSSRLLLRSMGMTRRATPQG